jgi:energy-coupling factor transporter ATP-binding protein EcfA2
MKIDRKKYKRAPEPMGIIPLHTSAVEIDGGAFLFLGPSGAGKSTIRRLLSTVARPLADDRVYLIPRETGEWKVVDAGDRIMEGPLTEKEAAVLRGPTLRAIFRLYQATKPRLEEIESLETCQHLTAAFFDLYWHENHPIQEKRLVFARLAGIARTIPGYRLHFSRSPETAILIRRNAHIANSTSVTTLALSAS